MKWSRSTAPSEADLAVVDAQMNLERIRERDEEVRQVSEASRILVRRNHFAERLQGLMGG